MFYCIPEMTRFAIQVGQFVWCTIMLLQTTYYEIRQSLFHQLVINIGKYLPKKGKVSENNGCRKARVIFADLSILSFEANISPY